MFKYKPNTAEHRIHLNLRLLFHIFIIFLFCILYISVYSSINACAMRNWSELSKWIVKKRGNTDAQCDSKRLHGNSSSFCFSTCNNSLSLSLKKTNTWTKCVHRELIKQFINILFSFHVCKCNSNFNRTAVYRGQLSNSFVCVE